jgi:guanylate kinase
MFVLSGPSGAGKSTVIGRMFELGLVDPETVQFSVSHTDRKAREGEVDGRDYHFISTELFREMIAEERFLEWAVVHGDLKGTAEDEVEPRLEAGFDVLLDVDVQGALQILERRPDSVSIMLLPPDYGSLSQRLQGRGSEDASERARRLSVSLSEIKKYEHYDCVIINEESDRASTELAAVIVHRRLRLERNRSRIERLVREFERSFQREAQHGSFIP